MFILLALLLTWVSWTAGRIFAGIFPSSRPTKLHALLFAFLCGPLVLGFLMVVRRFGTELLLRGESVLRLVDVWFGPFDPPMLFLYVFFAYGGAVSFYQRPKP